MNKLLWSKKSIKLFLEVYFSNEFLIWFILFNNEEVKEVAVYESVCTKRVAVSENMTPAQIEKITDKKIQGCQTTLDSGRA